MSELHIFAQRYDIVLKHDEEAVLKVLKWGEIGKVSLHFMHFPQMRYIVC